jgi:hypothetical protein
MIVGIIPVLGIGDAFAFDEVSPVDLVKGDWERSRNAIRPIARIVPVVRNAHDLPP